MRRLARRKLDETGDQWRELPARLRLVPRGGWINAIREALGMPRADLGRHMGVGGSTVAKLEDSERGRTIRLDSLQRAADALDCDLVYALVPRKPLQTLVDDQRLRLFKDIVERTDLHMRLEGQGVSDPDWRRHLLRQAEEVIPDTRLWRAKLPTA
jgi:predicted DNA-binding mobile mystery protein A